MMRLSLLTLLLLMAAPVVADETFDIRANSKSGQAWLVSSENTTELNLTLTPEEGDPQRGRQKMIERMKGTATVLKVVDGRPSAVRIEFDDSCGGHVDMNGQQRDVRSPLAGKTITVQRNEAGDVTNDAKLGPAESMVLAAILDQDEAYYPGKPVAIGDRWKPAPEVVAKSFQLLPDDKVSLTCTLDSVDESARGKVGVVSVAVDMVRAQGPLTVKIAGTGSVRIDLTTGKLIGGNLKGMVNSAGEQTVPGPNGDVTAKIVGKGSTLIVSSAKLVSAGGDAVPDEEPAAQRADPKAKATGSTAAGEYDGDGISVILNGAGGNMTGTIKMGDQSFSLNASTHGGDVKGTFKSGDSAFDFTGKIDGDTLALSSGGTDYKLKRRSVNPLSKPKKPNPLAKPQGAEPETGEPNVEVPDKTKPKTDNAHAGVEGKDFIRFRRFSLKDDQVIPGEAATFLIPADWKVTGGIKWRAHIYYPSYLDLQITAPDGLEQLNFLPAIPGFWPLQPMIGFPEGSIYAGNLVRPPMAPETFIRKLGIPYLRKSLLHAKEVKAEELPEMAKAILADTPQEAGVQKTTKAAKIRYRYEENGVAIDEDVYCVMLYGAGQAGVFWNTERIFTFRARAGDLEKRQAILATLQTSVRPNLEWFNRYYQIIQMRHDAGMQAIHDIGEWSKMYAKTSGEISDTITKSYWDRQASQDRINQSFSQSIRGVESYKDPSGYGYELPSGYNNAWVNNSGEVIVSTVAGYNPGVERQEDWHELTKTDH